MVKEIRLVDVCNPKQWKTISANELKSSGYPVYGANGIIGYYDTYNHEKETLLITCRGATCGTINISRQKSYINGNAMCLDDLSEEIDLYYLYYQLLHYDFNKIISGSAQPQITIEGLRKVNIVLHTMREQHKISALLKKTEDLIKHRKQQLVKLDELIKVRFVEMFGDPVFNPYKWESLKIGKAVTVAPQNGMYKPQSDYVNDGTGIPILRIDGFYDGVIKDLSKLKRLKCSEDEKKKYLLNEDDIVINRVNSIEYLGKCAHVNGLIEDTVYESNMMRMHFDEKRFNAIYVTHLLCSDFVYKQVVEHAKQAVNQASINQKDVMDFSVYSPPLELQNQFADFVQQINKSKLSVQKSLEKLETLKKALMQKYFG